MKSHQSQYDKETDQKRTHAVRNVIFDLRAHVQINKTNEAIVCIQNSL